MTAEEKDIVLSNSGAEIALDIVSFVSSAVPWIGGPISNVLSGVSYGRKLSRVKEVLYGVAEDLRELKSEGSHVYVKTEDFEELLERTLRQAADERNEEKRLIYGAFLTDAIKSPGEPYEEQIRFLRVLEGLQGDHIRILKACMQKPERTGGMIGSQGQTLSRRIPELTSNRIEDLVTQLNDLRITKLTGMRTMMTAQGAEDLRHAVTPFGQRFVRYLVKE